MKRKKMYIDMGEFERAVADFAEAGGTVIDFNTTIGDPLLDKRLLARARYVRSFAQFKSLGFVTTLQWLHKHDLNEFLDLFTWVGVSITLSGRESYRKFFGVDKYDQAYSNLKTLLRAVHAKGSNFSIGIGLKPTDEPAHTILSHPDFREINALVGGGLVDQVNNGGIYVDDWLGAVKLPEYLSKRPLYPRAFRPCAMLYGKLMIFSNGAVSACACRDFEASSDLILGDIRTDNIVDLWNGPRLKSIRKEWRLKNKVPDICKSCRHYLY
jgi:radical SAM protein with 4Fe4S-binding SPASM domain